MTLPIMSQYAKQKGIDILSAADWTHGLWFKEIRMHLEEATEGLYKIKDQRSNHVILGSKATPESDSGQARMTQRDPLFLLATEIASIYSQGGRVRRIHNLVFAPNFETAEKINKALVKRGCNLMSDGRPIIGLSSKSLLELILSIDERTMLIPCHIWTPHFGIYGSASGFDSLEEAFGELSQYVYGIETGLSSDPEMNWEVKELENRSILSFSDAHSPAKMGREATVFEMESPSYENVRRAIMREKNPITASETKQSQEIATSSRLSETPRNDNHILYTIEFYPEEGKYHFSGHRNCKVVFGPEDIKEKGNTCPVCKKRLTEGVLFRVQQLADQSLLNTVEEKISPHGIKWYTDKKKQHPPYVKLVPLLEIVAESMSSTVNSQKAKTAFADLCNTFSSELAILLKVPIAEIQKTGGVKLAEGIRRVREGTIAINPGFDGEYGKVKIWEEKAQSSKVKTQSEETKGKEQLGLFS